MTGSKIVTQTSKQMQAARKRGTSKTDWSRVRREAAAGKDPVADRDSPDASKAIRAATKRMGRPLAEQPRQMIALRMPVDTLNRWRSTGPGWQTRMVERLARI